MEFLKSVASDTRMRILLGFMGSEEMTVGQIAEAAEIGQSTASQNLAQLRRAGVVVARREGKEVYYRPDRNAILAHLDEISRLVRTCC